MCDDKRFSGVVLCHILASIDFSRPPPGFEAANSKLHITGDHQTLEQRRVLYRQRGQEVHIRRRETGEHYGLIIGRVFR